jgi:hypothetical protein
MDADYGQSCGPSVLVFFDAKCYDFYKSPIRYEPTSRGARSSVAISLLVVWLEQAMC